MNHRSVFQFLLFIVSVELINSCRPSLTKQLDRLLEDGTIMETAIFCAKHQPELKDRKEDCDRVTKEAKSEIDSILNRKLDLGIAPVIVSKSKGEEIEELLKVHTQLGIRYWEIWKSNVILE
ncbi:hypothetical protein EHQ59_10270 [Leptospira kemamanensis]|uniref:Uncharacterized protein n=1 Tax=Leptospira kemamanensis TaxID=2484942 RepID=A0A4R9JP77_9LEPT|nr:hypothetical protein [Leptospira kemamanensis]TGL51286.1 hypothetical protein EHQ59_10270 [Leptospira kemamanensis]